MDESLIKGLGLDAKLSHKVFSVFSWYRSHFNGLTDTNKIYLLTSNAQAKKKYQSLCTGASKAFAESIIDVNDFVLGHQA